MKRVIVGIILLGWAVVAFFVGRASVDEPVAEPVQAQVSEIDPAIKIELCKTRARNYADSEARQAYVKAAEEATAQGEHETASYLLLQAAEPGHPADYDINYQEVYMSCLSSS